MSEQQFCAALIRFLSQAVLLDSRCGSSFYLSPSISCSWRQWCSPLLSQNKAAARLFLFPPSLIFGPASLLLPQILLGPSSFYYLPLMEVWRYIAPLLSCDKTRTWPCLELPPLILEPCFSSPASLPSSTCSPTHTLDSFIFLHPLM